MKTYFEIKVCSNGTMETHIAKNKKEKNLWLMEYFTQGNARSWSLRKYEHYVQECMYAKKKPQTLNRYIRSLVVHASKIVMKTRNEIIFIFEKKFEKTLDKNK